MACLEHLQISAGASEVALKLACFLSTCRACATCDGLKCFRSVICWEGHLVWIA